MCQFNITASKIHPACSRDLAQRPALCLNIPMSAPKPKHLDLKKDEGLTIEWDDGRRSFYPVAHLRKLSPSADERERRAEQESNPLHVLPSHFAEQAGPIIASEAELIGNYAIRITFSDGHSTGIYSWAYLREIDPENG